jgi:hypothetical protein
MSTTPVHAGIRFCASPLTAAGLIAGNPATAGDDVNGESGQPASEKSSGALFNPFGTVAAASHQPAVIQRHEGGDWALPLLVALLGAVFIWAMIRKLLG